MKLEITPGSTLKNVTPEQVNDILEAVYKGIYVAATLVADDTKHRYLMASTGGYLEYSETKKAPVYQSENNPLEKCKAIFLNYLEGGTGWKNEIEWVKKKSEKNANLPGGWVVTDWNKLNAETLAWETDPKHQRVCPPLLQHMKITGKKSFWRR